MSRPDRANEPEGLTRDDILDNVTLYWLTNTTVSSARLYWESDLAFFAPKNVPDSRKARADTGRNSEGRTIAMT